MEDDRFVRPKLDASHGFSESVMSSVAEAVNKIKNALQQNQQMEQQSFISVTDAAFTERLEKAMLKNFDYLRRKDLGLLNNGPKTGSHHQQGSNRSSLYAGKAPVRLGVGSAAPVPATSAAASVSSALSAGSNAHPNSSQEPTSVYVSGLPTDISEEELEILFGSLGRIKKVKIYTTPLGKQKGDALITFSLSECAITACFKFNGLDIGEGHVIKVVKAEFNAKTNTTKTNGNSSSSNDTNGNADQLLIEYGSTGGLGSSGTSAGNGSGAGSSGSANTSTEQGFHNHFVHSTSTKNDIGSRAYSTNTPSAINTSHSQTTNTNTTTSNTITITGTTIAYATPSILYTLLPPETEAGVHPVVLILNAFDPANGHEDDPGYFDELETDMLLECCNFGKVRTIQLLTLPPHYLAALSSAPLSRVGSVSGVLGGAIGVTFQEVECADKCASGLRDRRFDGRVLKTHVLLPRKTESSSNSGGVATTTGSNSVSQACVPPPPPPPRPPSVPKPANMSPSVVPVVAAATSENVKEEASAPDIEAISNDVDDFLSSLL